MSATPRVRIVAAALAVPLIVALTACDNDKKKAKEAASAACPGNIAQSASTPLPSDVPSPGGTVYDYNANAAACTEQPKVQPGDTHPFYDSTDAYAATWLSAMRAYAQANPADWAWFQSPDIVYWMDQEAHVSIYTLQPNGLTWAKPDYPRQYLMDNIEVLQGLNDYIWIAQNVLNDRGKVNYWTSYANTLSQGIQTYLWDDVTKGATNCTPGPLIN